MSLWIILSWVLVAILTAINIAIFLKLKQASEQMLKMAFPNAKNMNEALAGMQKMMGGMQGMGGMGGMGGMMGAGSRGPGMPGTKAMQRGKGGNPFAGGSNGKNTDAQLKAAMDMLQQMQKGNKR